MLLATIISILVSLDVDVDTCVHQDTCYRMSSRLFRDATTLVAQHGLLMQQVATLKELDSLNTVTRTDLSNRIKLSDAKASKQDTVISANKGRIVKAYVIGGSVGYILGILTATLIVLGSL